MIAALYIRVSTADQAEKGYSLDTQLAENRHKAAELGATAFVEFVDDGYSGEYIERPALTALRDGLEKKEFDLVVVYDPDRLARNLAHQLIITDEIEKSGAKLLFVSVTFEESPEGKLFYSMRGAIAAYEKEKIKERTTRGKKGKARQGKLVSNGRCYGYDYDKAQSMYVINDEQAEIVRLIFDLCITNQLGTALISKELNCEGIPAPRGNQWSASSIHRILTNTAYKGIIYSMKKKSTKTGFNTRRIEVRPESEWIPIQVPFIIDSMIWSAAQQQLQVNKTVGKRNLKLDHLLQGVIYCGRCGRKMCIKHSGKNKQIISYYVCNSQVSTSCLYGGGKCIARRIPANIIDELVWNKLYELLLDSKFITDYIKNNPSDLTMQKLENALLRLKVNEQKTNIQKETTLRWFRQQLIDSKDAEKQLATINKRLMDIENSQKKIQTELDFWATQHKTRATGLPIKPTVKDLLYCNEDERKLAVRAGIAKVLVQRIDATCGKSSTPEFTVDLQLL